MKKTITIALSAMLLFACAYQANAQIEVLSNGHVIINSDVGSDNGYLSVYQDDLSLYTRALYGRNILVLSQP